MTRRTVRGDLRARPATSSTRSRGRRSPRARRSSPGSIPDRAAPATTAAAALVVACGLGDDAEELAGRGWRTAGFDVSPTAIARCHERFPDSAVEYEVADLFALPARFTGAFGVVVEIRTLQSLPLDVRGPAVAAIARTVAPGGVVYVRCFGREPGQPAGRRPWPVSRDELAGFERAGLSVRSFAQEGPPGAGCSRSSTSGRAADRRG